MRFGIHVPILLSGAVALGGLVRAREEVGAHPEITYEIAALAVLLMAVVVTFIVSAKRRTNRPETGGKG